MSVPAASGQGLPTTSTAVLPVTTTATPLAAVTHPAGTRQNMPKSEYTPQGSTGMESNHVDSTSDRTPATRQDASRANGEIIRTVVRRLNRNKRRGPINEALPDDASVYEMFMIRLRNVRDRRRAFRSILTDLAVLYLPCTELCQCALHHFSNESGSTYISLEEIARPNLDEITRTFGPSLETIDAMSCSKALSHAFLWDTARLAMAIRGPLRQIYTTLKLCLVKYCTEYEFPIDDGKVVQQLQECDYEEAMRMYTILRKMEEGVLNGYKELRCELTNFVRVTREAREQLDEVIDLAEREASNLDDPVHMKYMATDERAWFVKRIIGRTLDPDSLLQTDRRVKIRTYEAAGAVVLYRWHLEIKDTVDDAFWLKAQIRTDLAGFDADATEAADEADREHEEIDQYIGAGGPTMLVRLKIPNHRLQLRIPLTARADKLRGQLRKIEDDFLYAQHAVDSNQAQFDQLTAPTTQDVKENAQFRADFEAWATEQNAEHIVLKGQLSLIERVLLTAASRNRLQRSLSAHKRGTAGTIEGYDNAPPGNDEVSREMAGAYEDWRIQAETTRGDLQMRLAAAETALATALREAGELVGVEDVEGAVGRVHEGDGGGNAGGGGHGGGSGNGQGPGAGHAWGEFDLNTRREVSGELYV